MFPNLLPLPGILKKLAREKICGKKLGTCLKCLFFWYFSEKSMFAVLDRSNHLNKAVFGNFYFHRCWVPCACGAACSYQFLQANTWPPLPYTDGF